jgi:ribosomal protein S24E
MELEILEEKENVLLKRKEVKINIKHPSSPTPKKQELIKEISSRYSVPEENVVLDYIFTKKGIPESFAKAKIYKEAPKKVEKGEKPKEEKSEAQAS